MELFACYQLIVENLWVKLPKLCEYNNQGHLSVLFVSLYSCQSIQGGNDTDSEGL